MNTELINDGNLNMLLYLMVKPSSIYTDRIIWYCTQRIAFSTDDHYFAKVLGVEEGVIYESDPMP